MLRLRQFIPSNFCLKCFGCCRFAESKTIWAPYGYKLKIGKDCYLCPNLNEKDNACAVYANRPFDCQLYPFLLVKNGKDISLGLHKDCCFVSDNNPGEAIYTYASYLIKELNKKSFIFFIKKNPRLAAEYNYNVEILADSIFLPRLKKLTIKNKAMVDAYLKNKNPGLSAHSFAGIFIWNTLFDIFWTKIEGCLCIFYRDKIGMFMILPPQGKTTAWIIGKCFAIMDFYNRFSPVSRIENVAGSELKRYGVKGREDFTESNKVIGKNGLRPRLKEQEYVCLRQDLVSLTGPRFRHKRSSYNYFSKNYKAEVCEYKSGMYNDCIRLFNSWKDERRLKFQDSIYQHMLEDNFLSFKTALKNFWPLGLSGCVVVVAGEIKACSFGYPVGKDMFCVLFEVCDLRLKGIAQFIFREFCKKLPGYKYINIMGASELASLKSAKLSWRPVKKVDVYNIYPAFADDHGLLFSSPETQSISGIGK